jgi:hypothetical protein
VAANGHLSPYGSSINDKASRSAELASTAKFESINTCASWKDLSRMSFAYQAAYRKPRKPAHGELELLNRADDYGPAIFDEPRTPPKIPHTYSSDYYFSEPRPSDNRPLKRRRYFSTAVVVSYALLALSVVSTVATVVAFVLTHQHAQRSNLYQLYPQSIPILKSTCDSKSLQIWNLVAHLFVNFIGTIVLGLSNYIQQLCASPTIEDISTGFRRRGDVLFGSNSPAAVLQLGHKGITLMWILLILTSLPLHIMLNGITGFAAKAVEAERRALTVDQTSLLTPIQLSWTNISAAQCVDLLISSRAHVTNFVNITTIIKDNLPEDAVSYYNGSGESYYAKSSDLINCYANMVQSECQLTVRWFPLLFATLAIIAKAVVIAVFVRRHIHFKKTLHITVGDMIVAAASHPEFLREVPNPSEPKGAIFEGIYRRQRIAWRRTLGRSDIITAIFWWISAISVTTIGIYSWYNVVGGLHLSDRLKRFGLGTEDPATSLVSGATGQPFQIGPPFPLQVVIANMPQVWLTIGYLTWNNMIGRIWLEKEWRTFYRTHQLPRVSYNSRAQGLRSARWLQLPYWLTVTLMSISVFLHWLVSQTLFVVEIYFADTNIASVFHLHYSPLAIISVGTFATFLVFGMTVYYLVPITTWMPMMAGSARVVWDSCSRLAGSDLPRNGISWGDISYRNERLAGFGQVVGRMVEGVQYPGLISEEQTAPPFDYPFVTDFDTEPLVKRSLKKSGRWDST